MTTYAKFSESFVRDGQSQDLEDIKAAWREGTKKGPPNWLAPIPKTPKIVAWKLPYLGGWRPEPSPSHTSCALPDRWRRPGQADR